MFGSGLDHSVDWINLILFPITPVCLDHLAVLRPLGHDDEIHLTIAAY